MSYKWHHNFPKIAREAGFIIRELSVGHCIDWRFIASIDPYGIVSERDYEKLDEFIPHIAEVPIGSVLNNRILDPAIGKYFVLAQFSIQYLLFCKQFLDETVLEIRNTIETLQDENVRLAKMNKKRNEEMTQLQKKLQRAETMEQHHHQHSPAIYPCTKCTKNFISTELLSAHMARKHTGNVPRPVESASFERKPASTTDTNLINTIKLELEVKQLKERLNAAEKDLHLHRTNKHHRCRVCSEDSSSTMDRPPAKVLHSVAIQSNLTDDKDSNEKVAQNEIFPSLVQSVTMQDELTKEGQVPVVDLLSKSDLQSFLEEQKRLFESWKAGERQTLNQEIEIVKRYLADVMQTMEKSERSTPTPAVEEGGVWKDRYHELERMYEISQKQAQEAIGSFERVYTQKMEQLERLLRETRALERKENQHDNSTVVEGKRSLLDRSSNLKMVTLPTVVIESEFVPVDVTEPVEEHKAQTTQIISSDSDQAESDAELNANVQPAQTRRSPRVKSPVLVEAIHEPITESKPQAQHSQHTLLISPKKQIFNQFRARLKAIGVDPKAKQLFGETLNTACRALADRRDLQRQKHSHFFITRNQLLAKVDQIARTKSGEALPSKTSSQLSVRLQQEPPVVMSREPRFASTKVPAVKPRLKTASTMELLPSKQKLLGPGESGPVAHQTDMNVFKSKITVAAVDRTYRPTIKLTDNDIITVHADVSGHLSEQDEFTVTPNTSKRPSISSYDQQVERLLHTPIKTIHPTGKTQDHPRLEEGEMVESVSTLKPIPKKRVLFNLDKDDHTKTVSAGQPVIVETYSRSHQKPDAPTKTLKVDDESDWNISSFDEDK